MGSTCITKVCKLARARTGLDPFNRWPFATENMIYSRAIVPSFVPFTVGSKQ
jgi:hypothetical protein